MKKISVILLSLSIFIHFSSATFAGDYDQGMFELNRGSFNAAIAEFEPLVAEHYAPAQYQMALIYLHGYGVRKNPKKAFDLLSLAASQNEPEALFDLAVMYSEGDIVEKDLKTAFSLTERAAASHLDTAEYNLGVMYYHGQGIKKNSAKAARWYEKAAKQNYALAQFNLALMYFEGIGVDKSIEKSYIWNIIAARNHYKPASKSLELDERNLTIHQIEESRNKADKLHQQILQQKHLRAKKTKKLRN